MVALSLEVTKLPDVNWDAENTLIQGDNRLRNSIAAKLAAHGVWFLKGNELTNAATGSWYCESTQSKVDEHNALHAASLDD